MFRSRWCRVAGFEKCSPCGSTLFHWDIPEGLQALRSDIVPKLIQQLLIRHERNVIAEADEDGSPNRVSGVCTGKRDVGDANAHPGDWNAYSATQEGALPFQDGGVAPDDGTFIILNHKRHRKSC